MADTGGGGRAQERGAKIGEGLLQQDSHPSREIFSLERKPWLIVSCLSCVFRESAAVSIRLKRICWVTLFGMRLQKTVNSPTQLRAIQHKQGRDGVNNKAWAHISAPQTTTHHPFSFLSHHPVIFTLLPNLPFSTPPPHHPPPTANFPLSPSSPPIHSRCLGNNTKRFSSQLCHRGNAWLSSRPLLEARRLPACSYWPLSNRSNALAWTRGLMPWWSSVCRCVKIEALRLWNQWRLGAFRVSKFLSNCLDWRGFVFF